MSNLVFTGPRAVLSQLSADTTVMFSQLLEDDELVAMVLAKKPYDTLLEYVNENY
jgi:cystathionine beta-lyase family protein involved in aluminum resistance